MAKNQCDGCRRGLLLIKGVHMRIYPWNLIGWTAHLYEEERPYVKDNEIDRQEMEYEENELEHKE